VLTNAPNLIANPGFEDGDSKPLSWSFVSTNGNNPARDTVSRSGAGSIKISISGTEDNRSGYPKSDLMEAEPLAYYNLSAWRSPKAHTTGQRRSSPSGQASIPAISKFMPISGRAAALSVWTMRHFRHSLDAIYLNGALTQNPDGTVTQRTRQNDIDFTFYYIPKERYIEFHEEMQDRRGEERALQVMYNLP
jgi:hypothetical protein